MPTSLKPGVADEILLVLAQGPLGYEALKSEFVDVSREHFVSHLIELVEAHKISWTPEGIIDLRLPSPTIATTKSNDDPSGPKTS